MSYDSTSRYGLQTPFSEMMNRLFKGSMWHVDGAHNTLITTGNGGTEQTRVQVTLFYNGGQSKYRVEKLLPPGQQIWLNLGELIRNQVPDSDGKTIPADVMFGSYELRDLDHPILGLLYEGKLVVDKTYGHASYGCAHCCGYSSAQLSPTPFGGPPGLDNTDVYQAYSVCNSAWEDFDYAFNAQSSNTAVATLVFPKLHTVAPGAATGSGKNTLSYQPAKGESCVNAPMQGTQGVSVTPSISPAQGLIGATLASVTITGSGFGSSPTVTAGTGITITVNSRSDTTITAKFVIATTAPAGNSPITVTTTAGTKLPAVNFYVQIPSKLSISNITAMVVITNGNVLDYFGNVVRTNRCGEYRDVASNLLDQQGGTILGGDFTFTESFSNYSTTLVPNPGPPPTQSSTQNTSVQILADTQFFGFVAPGCPGSNDHEAFDQSFQVTLGSANFPLTTVYHIERGVYSGTPEVNITVKTP
jgi:hypothetical protein